MHSRGAYESFLLFARPWLMADSALYWQRKNQVYGGAVIGRAGKRCWYVWGAADKHEQFNVGHILQWKALLWAKSHGCREYDFGGYTPGAKSGPAWFKAASGEPSCISCGRIAK